MAKSKPPKSEPVGVRLEQSVRADLERIAERDCRSLSGLINKIVVDWLRSQPPAPPEPTAPPPAS